MHVARVNQGKSDQAFTICVIVLGSVLLVLSTLYMTLLANPCCIVCNIKNHSCEKTEVFPEDVHLCQLSIPNIRAFVMQCPLLGEDNRHCGDSTLTKL